MEFNNDDVFDVLLETVFELRSQVTMLENELAMARAEDEDAYESTVDDGYETDPDDWDEQMLTEEEYCEHIVKKFEAKKEADLKMVNSRAEVQWNI